MFNSSHFEFGGVRPDENLMMKPMEPVVKLKISSTGKKMSLGSWVQTLNNFDEK